MFAVTSEFKIQMGALRAAKCSMRRGSRTGKRLAYFRRPGWHLQIFTYLLDPNSALGVHFGQSETRTSCPRFKLPIQQQLGSKINAQNTKSFENYFDPSNSK
jgi:hypothetical protein